MQEFSCAQQARKRQKGFYPTTQNTSFHRRSLICFCCWWLQITVAVLPWAFFCRISSGALNEDSRCTSLHSQSIPWMKSYLSPWLSQKHSTGKHVLALKKALLWGDEKQDEREMQQQSWTTTSDWSLRFYSQFTETPPHFQIFSWQNELLYQQV